MEANNKDDISNPTQDSSLPQQNPYSARNGLNLVTTDADLENYNGSNKIETIKLQLESDIRAVDIKWSVFVTAAQSYRYDSCLKPYPPQFIVGENDKDIERLRKVMERIPPLPQLLIQLKEHDMYQKDPDIIDLLHWVLMEQEPKLVSVPKEELNKILHLAPSEMTVNKPNFIFCVSSNSSEARWKKMVDEYGKIYAYHGSRLENFHSILRHGLQQHLNKNGLFGAGIYLSSELGVSLPYSSAGCSWNNSMLGTQLSCVALCEAINHPDVKCKQPGLDEVDRSRSITRDSVGGEVPDKYYVVCNSDLVRVQYLFVYCKQQPRLMSPSGHNDSRCLSWLRQHKMIAFVATYVTLLFAIGLGNSPQVLRYFRITMRRLGF